MAESQPPPPMGFKFRVVPAANEPGDRSTPTPQQQPQPIQRQMGQPPPQPVHQPQRPMHYVASAPTIRTVYQGQPNNEMQGGTYIVSQSGPTQGQRIVLRPGGYQPIMQPAPIQAMNTQSQYRGSPLPQPQYTIRQAVPQQPMQVHQIQSQPAPSTHVQHPQQVVISTQPQQDSSQLTPQSNEQSVQKCARFFKTLLHLSQNNKQYNSPDVATKVRELVRGVVHGPIEPEEFTKNLQEVLHSQAQPNLLPFLQKTLPFLREALRNGQVTIDGLDSNPSQMTVKHKPSEATMQRPGLDTQPVVIKTEVMSQSSMSRPSSTANLQAVTSAPPPASSAPPSTMAHSSQPLEAVPISHPSTSTVPTLVEAPPKAATPKTITVVDTAGNAIPQEPRPTAEVIPTRPLTSDQLKYTFLDINALAQRVVGSMPENTNGIVDEEVLTLISQAVETRLRTLLGHLSLVAEHRLEPFRANPLYEQIDDPRKQIRFVEDVEKAAYNRREMLEKEQLLRLSKSKGKDKDTLERAKELQQKEQEARLNRDANAAAIAALGGKATLKRTWAESNNALNQPAGDGVGMPSHRARIKRVTTKDLQFVMGIDPQTRKSNIYQRLAYSSIAAENNPPI